MRLTVSTLTTLVVLGLVLSDEALASPFLWSNTPSVSPSNMKNEEIVPQKFGERSQISTHKVKRSHDNIPALWLRPLPLLDPRDPKEMTEIERFIQDDSIRLVNSSHFLLNWINSCALGQDTVEEQRLCFRKIPIQLLNLNATGLNASPVSCFMKNYRRFDDTRHVFLELESTRRENIQSVSNAKDRGSVAPELQAAKTINDYLQSSSIFSQVSNDDNNHPNALHFTRVIKSWKVKDGYVKFVDYLMKTFDPKIKTTDLMYLTLSAYDLVYFLLDTMREETKEAFEITEDNFSNSKSDSSSSSGSRKQSWENERQYLEYLTKIIDIVNKKESEVSWNQEQKLQSSSSK
ncbi:MAG: hypothetical protein DHS80DRAFT_31453 [Piptocephalis tieghemiana]|nr:MAG: hypothetical protein DHS80DRAFT_31453 [Piptocephalis tieghemiana]